MENQLDPKTLAAARAQLAQQGGKANLKKHGKEFYKRISEKGIKALRKKYAAKGIAVDKSKKK